MSEIYLSTDIEADGRIPGINSMLSFATAAYTADKKLLGTFSANLFTLPDAVTDPDTMEWWKTQPDAWAECQRDRQDPKKVMTDYVAWLKGLPGELIFVGYPAAYDFLFVYWYIMRFAGESPFSYSALDIASYVMAVLKIDYSDVSKSTMPKEWFDPIPHTHKALDDAIGQGALFCNILAVHLAM